MTRILGILALTAVLAAGACGGSSAAGSGTTSTTVDPDQAMRAFATCMREHGVDMPDPVSDGKGRGRVTLSGKPGDEQKLTDAQKACDKYMKAAGPSNLSPQNRQAMQDAMVKFAQCMRSHGIDMPDPGADGGGVMIKSKPGTREVVDDPAFQAAEKECRDKYLAPAEKKAGIDPPTKGRNSSGGASGGSSRGLDVSGGK
jgi:hypothetical protein